MSEGESSPSPARLLVLHAIRIRGVAAHDVIVTMTDLDGNVVEEHLTRTDELGLTTYREGARIRGWSLTPAGRDHHREALREDVDHRAREAIERAYARFITFNEPFKALCTRWQLEDQPPSCVSDLADLHGSVEPTVTELATSVARFAPYKRRLRDAVERFRRGDTGALAAPLSGSYHDVWMELHEDFLLSLHRARSAHDGH